MNARAGTTAASLIAIAVWCAPAAGQLIEKKPEAIEDVGVDNKLGEDVPLELKFRNDRDQVIKLGDLFASGRPVLLTLNYSGCPRLCRVQLNGLVACLKDMEWTTGREFDVVSVSIDPKETFVEAARTKQLYVNQYQRPAGAGGWHFLTGAEKNIKKLADAVGFRYQYQAETGEYAHAPSVMVCSPDGVITRYLNDVYFEPQTVRLSLVEAAEGKVGTTFDQFLLFCFHYDPTTGKYGPMAQRMMALGGAVTVLVLGVSLLPYWLRRSAAIGADDSDPLLATTAVSDSPRGHGGHGEEK